MKQFLIVGSTNVVIDKDVFPLVKDNEIRIGYNWHFNLSATNCEGTVGCGWYTTLAVDEPPKLELKSKYNEKDYPKYDNMDAVEVGKTNNIPYDYQGIMGVPITFLKKWNRQQFELFGIACGNSWANYTADLKSINFNPNIKYGGGLGVPVLNGKAKYTRLLVRNILE